MAEIAERVFDLASTVWVIVKHLIAIAAIGAVVEAALAIVFIGRYAIAVAAGESALSIVGLPVWLLMVGVQLAMVWLVGLLPESVVAGWLTRKRVLSARRATLVGCAISAGIGVTLAALLLLSEPGIRLPDGLWMAAAIIGAACGFGGLFLIYHGIVHLLGPLPGRMRRMWRRRRGQCPECGYPRVGNAVCPECGHAVERVY
jgi:hypothetical protein